ncbi:MAG: hypothetical protein ACRDIB_03550, partial [Ardenticatenaceae bacterium]
MMNQEGASPLGDVAHGGRRAAVLIKGAADFDGMRAFLLPGLLLLILLAPLLRQGIPATQAGLLVLQPELARETFPSVIGWLSLDGEFDYKLVMGLAVALASLSVGLLARVIWGQAVAWWVVSLWLVLPLTLSSIYQYGWPYAMLGVASLAIGSALLMHRRPWRWIGPLLWLGGGVLLWTTQPALTPQELFFPSAPGSTLVRMWLAEPSLGPGLVLVALCFVAGAAAWPLRKQAGARWILRFLFIAIIGLGLTLLGGPVRLCLVIAALALLM